MRSNVLVLELGIKARHCRRREGCVLVFSPCYYLSLTGSASILELVLSLLVLRDAIGDCICRL